MVTERSRDCAICSCEITAPNCRTTCGSEECQTALRRAKGRNREHRKRVAESDITAAAEHQMRERARKCPLCNVTLTGRPHLPSSKELDHILPVNQGGTHTLGNVRIICRKCNQSRPRDGSDFTGQLTLWAQSPGVISRQRTMCGNGLHPWVRANIGLRAGKKYCKACKRISSRTGPLQRCGCGEMFAPAGRTSLCPVCIGTTGHRAAQLHASGQTWNEVAKAVGYDTAEGARFAAKRIGYTPGPRRPRPQPEMLACSCGAPLPSGLSTCSSCLRESDAWRAVRLRNEGRTLRAVADVMGYRSVTSVTNLMKTVIEIKPYARAPRICA